MNEVLNNQVVCQSLGNFQMNTATLVLMTCWAAAATLAAIYFAQKNG